MDFGSFIHNFRYLYKLAVINKRTTKRFADTYYNRGEYTEFINKIMKDKLIYAYPGTSPRIKYYPEYYRIDHTYWETSKQDSFGKVSIYDWSLDFVVEHENDCSWTEETAKLDFIKCPLKIVIGYMDNKKRENEIKIIEKQRRFLKNLDDGEEFGVILMNRDLGELNEQKSVKIDEPTCNHILEILDMRYYLLKEDGICRLEIGEGPEFNETFYKGTN